MKNRHIRNLFILLTEHVNHSNNCSGISMGLKLASTRVYKLTAGEGLRVGLLASFVKLPHTTHFARPGHIYTLYIYIHI